ncbi:MAG: DNA mismatch endonuclease Vsr [Deltaproteobacteria bacterium]|nr:DNA mismatch endonuclease Vsr [Deltaproteobacteria bacterium]MBN2845296.1 DNA mismatch endonuclease Vsr [Deltaproteobacteria bacterium]
MTDHLEVRERSWNMSRIRSKNTGPERQVRSLLHSLGFRFRLHRRDLPGSPDMVLPKYSTIVFVHGCFWHQHPGCKAACKPKSNTEYWLPKLARNKQRDRENQKALKALGWNVVVVWECELNDLDSLTTKLLKAVARRHVFGKAVCKG